MMIVLMNLRIYRWKDQFRKRNLRIRKTKI